MNGSQSGLWSNLENNDTEHPIFNPSYELFGRISLDKSPSLKNTL